MSEINEILNGPAATFNETTVWHRLDAILESLPDDQRVLEWSRIAEQVEARNIPSGHAHFKLGILHLVNDADEATGIRHLEAAYEQDQEFSGRREPHRLAAYRVLALVKDFLDYLKTKTTWQADQLQPPHRQVLIKTLLGVYDRSTQHILDAGVMTYSPFYDLFKDQDLRRFAIENYQCAYGLLEMVSVASGRSFFMQHEYPLSRALVGLYGGVLEAILADQLGNKGEATLGKLMHDAYTAGIIKLGTRLCSLATVMLYFRNHIHPNKDIARQEYFVDINVAKSLKVATELVVNELPKQKKP